MPDESNLDLLHNINQEIEALGRVIEEMVIWIDWSFLPSGSRSECRSRVRDLVV